MGGHKISVKAYGRQKAALRLHLGCLNVLKYA